ncbi:hypothetical protein HYX17_00915 [Candidatus Woesearchaeota archaeon]|nr:hypothetical protein [Candidatus Woesearchaeota archaeon]
MQKRGQATILVVLGIVLIALIAFFLFISGKISLKPQPEEFPDVELYLQRCLDDTVKIGQGIAIKSDDFKSSLEEYIKTNLPLKCNDFSKFSGYNINAEAVNDVKVVLIQDKNLIVEVDWPVRITKGDKIISLNKFVSKTSLKISFCFPIIVDRNCKAIESKQINVMGIQKKFNIGDKVSFNIKGSGDVCVAC